MQDKLIIILNEPSMSSESGSEIHQFCKQGGSPRGQLRDSTRNSQSNEHSSMEEGCSAGQNLWTQQEVKLLQRLYCKHGACWSLIKTKFPSKSTSSLKNKVNNSVRRVASLLKAHNSKILISSHRILVMLNLCFQTERRIEQLRLTINSQSILSGFKSNVIRLCFKEDPLPQDMEAILDSIRLLNRKLRSYGIFKAKTSKSWQLTTKAFHHILDFDKLYLEEGVDVKAREKEAKEWGRSQDAAIQAPVEAEAEAESEIDLVDYNENYQYCQRNESEMFNLEREYCQIVGANYSTYFTDFF